ncbi:MAG: HEAT repeat domain-containing protein [Halobacteriovoraceae bacterium]|nr:HEAT repeat domain-containing protein [Halobacteriovoraceae bacterium]
MKYFNALFDNPNGYQHPAILENILLIEMFLVLFGIGILFFFHKLNQQRQTKKRKIQEEIRKRLIFLVENKKKPGFNFLTKNGWNKIKLVLPVVEGINKKYSENIYWLFVMDALLDEVLFPQARDLAMSPFWFKRNLALRCLSLSPRKQDESYFLNFLCDPITHNQFGAIKPLLEVGSAYSLNVIVEVMESENRHTQAVFLSMTKYGGSNFYEAIRLRLQRETDPAAKRVCIDILSDSLERSDLFLIKKSLFDKDKQLRLTALRCLGKFEIHHSTQLLLSFLSDDLWEVRSLAAKFLGKRKAYQAIPKLRENACDRNWWVRMNSIDALFELGDSGRIALESITPEKDRYAYEMLQYVQSIKDEEGRERKAREAAHQIGQEIDEELGHFNNVEDINRKRSA